MTSEIPLDGLLAEIVTCFEAPDESTHQAKVLAALSTTIIPQDVAGELLAVHLEEPPPPEPPAFAKAPFT